ncbi:energy transducer TonB [Phenylobacterium sp.]|uniref:energy transducer TonB family protein n=1 Tax=Phenylobacterium sp. TaxID=1871053 RepID=UPI0028110C1B|nr:energy transducer TonB [Phenylobacterium sp.]
MIASVVLTLAAPAAAVEAPRLLRLPSAYERAMAYPSHASERQLDGRAVLRCRVTSIGTAADCSVKSETPAGQGFGQAAMSLRSRLRFTPPTGGQDPWVEIPLNFEGAWRKALREGDPNR